MCVMIDDDPHQVKYKAFNVLLK